MHQHGHIPQKCKELVRCLFCNTSSYPNDAEHGVVRVGRHTRYKGVFRLDKLAKHIDKTHLECIPVEGKPLLDMGFTMESNGDVAPNIPEVSVGDDSLNRPGLLAGDFAHDTTDVVGGNVARNTPAYRRLVLASQGPISIAQRGIDMRQPVCRSYTRCTAPQCIGVPPSTADNSHTLSRLQLLPLKQY